MVLLLAGCLWGPAAEPVESVRYSLAWRGPGKAVEPMEGGLRFTTDKGYTVELTKGTVVAYSQWLENCPEEVGFTVFPVAYAGHSAMANPTASKPSVIEDLLDPKPFVHEPLAVPSDGNWCGVQSLVARADVQTKDLLPEMKGKSMHLVGSWAGPDGEVHPFDWSTTLHHVHTSDADWASGVGPRLEIRVERSVEGLFDGIAFESTVPAVIMRSVVQNFVGSTVHRTARTSAKGS